MIVKRKIKNNGFTLIELLAVIVILAIIALIAVPIILNVIESARLSAFKDSAYGVIKAAELKLADMDLKEEEIFYPYSFNFEKTANQLLDYKGTTMITGIALIADPNSNVELIEVSDGNFCANGNVNKLDAFVGSCDQNPLVRKPDIKANRAEEDYSYEEVTITIDYFQPDSKKYKINDGEWSDYTGPFTLTNETDGMITIYAQGFTGDVGSNIAEKKLSMLLPIGYEGIYDRATLEAVNNNLSGNYIVVKDFSITEDNTNDWVSIGEFNGILEGSNYTITDLKGTNMGLFSGSRGTIKNLTVEGNVTAANSYAGMITGWNRGLLENVHAKGTLVCANYCGGVTGFSGDNVNIYGTVKNSSSEVDITIPYGSASNVGGLVGYRGAIDNSYYKGTITGTQNTHQYIGGIIGYSPNSLTNSYAEVDINIAGNASKAIGGAIGYSEDANINTSGNYVKGKVTTDGYYVGGFLGELYAGTITKNYSEVDVVGTTSVGGFFGYGRLGTILNNFSTGDVTGSGTYNYIGGFAGHINFGSYGSLWVNYSLGKIIGGHGNTGGFGYGGVSSQGGNTFFQIWPELIIV